MARWLRCWLGWCGGDVISAWHADNHCWRAWKCRQCGMVKHAEQTDLMCLDWRAQRRLQIEMGEDPLTGLKGESDGVG